MPVVVLLTFKLVNAAPEPGKVFANTDVHKFLNSTGVLWNPQKPLLGCSCKYKIDKLSSPRFAVTKPEKKCPQDPVQDHVLAKPPPIASHHVRASLPLHHRFQRTENVDTQHRLKTRAGFSLGFSDARRPFPEKDRSCTHLATGAPRSQPDAILTCLLRRLPFLSQIRRQVRKWSP